MLQALKAVTLDRMQRHIEAVQLCDQAFAPATCARLVPTPAAQLTCHHQVIAEHPSLTDESALSTTLLVLKSNQQGSLLLHPAPH